MWLLTTAIAEGLCCFVSVLHLSSLVELTRTGRSSWCVALIYTLLSQTVVDTEDAPMGMSQSLMLRSSLSCEEGWGACRGSVSYTAAYRTTCRTTKSCECKEITLNNIWKGVSVVFHTNSPSTVFTFYSICPQKALRYISVMLKYQGSIYWGGGSFSPKHLSFLPKIFPNCN